jgi:N-(2-amino-2-carboxyethyl)-L-glutamate synthase
MIYQRVYDIVPDDVFLTVDGVLAHSDVYLKIEGLNPAGSIKMKTALGLVQDLERRGVLGAGGRIIESSSGNLGIALGLISAAKGYRFTCVCDPNTATDSVSLMRSIGTEVIIIGQRDVNGGYLGSRIDYIRGRLTDDPDLIWLNQYANPSGAAAHARTTAAAILRELKPVDYLFVAAGTTGTLMGCAAYFRTHSPSTRVIAVDAKGSVTFGGVPGRRYIPGIGTSRRPELCRPGLVDDVVLVDELDAIRSCRWLARTTGLVAGGSTGSVLAALRAYPAVSTGSTVVAIAPDLGDRYLQTVYSDGWVRETFGAGAEILADPWLPLPGRKEEFV